MRGWSAIVVGFLLLGLAVWSFAWDGFNSSTVMCGVAAAILFARGAKGLGYGDVGDPLAVIQFVRNPAGAIVDTAANRLGDWLDDQPAGGEGGKGGFDPEAVLERYLAKRGPDPVEQPPAAPAPAPSAPASPAPPTGFGRKGL